MSLEDAIKENTTVLRELIAVIGEATPAKAQVSESPKKETKKISKAPKEPEGEPTEDLGGNLSYDDNIKPATLAFLKEKTEAGEDGRALLIAILHGFSDKYESAKHLDESEWEAYLKQLGA